MTLKTYVTLGSAVAAAGGVMNRQRLRLWGLRTLAGNGPVMMNVTIDNGTVMVKSAKFCYFYRNTVKGSPGAAFSYETPAA